MRTGSDRAGRWLQMTLCLVGAVAATVILASLAAFAFPGNAGASVIGTPEGEAVLVSTNPTGLEPAGRAPAYPRHGYLLGATPLADIPAGAEAFPEPPAGGVTIGYSGTTSPAALVEAQPFTVASVTVLDVVSQQFLTYIPDAPPFANTLTERTLNTDAVTMIRRAGELGAPPHPPAPGTVSPPLHGTPRSLDAPPRGGITMGLAGTNDIEGLREAQSFTVETIAALQVPSQEWLIHVVGAPAAVSTLTPATLSSDVIVAMRRAGDPPSSTGEAAEPAAEPEGVSAGVARITYYFCERGSNTAAWGDGGGFCGYMRSGNRVYAGAAACAPNRFGERFKIVGDPSDRVYTCEDTGGAVGSGHRDVWFHNSDDAYRWREAVGPTAEIMVIE